MSGVLWWLRCAAASVAAEAAAEMDSESGESGEVAASSSTVVVMNSCSGVCRVSTSASSSGDWAFWSSRFSSQELSGVLSLSSTSGEGWLLDPVVVATVSNTESRNSKPRIDDDDDFDLSDVDDLRKAETGVVASSLQ